VCVRVRLCGSVCLSCMCACVLGVSLSRCLSVCLLCVGMYACRVSLT